MALVTTIEPSHKDRQTVHRPTRCLYSIVIDDSGARYVPLDTVGSEERQFADKVSQTIQFDRASATRLIELFRVAFPELI